MKTVMWAWEHPIGQALRLFSVVRKRAKRAETFPNICMQIEGRRPNYMSSVGSIRTQVFATVARSFQTSQLDAILAFRMEIGQPPSSCLSEALAVQTPGGRKAVPTSFFVRYK